MKIKLEDDAPIFIVFPVYGASLILLEVQAASLIMLYFRRLWESWAAPINV